MTLFTVVLTENNFVLQNPKHVTLSDMSHKNNSSILFSKSQTQKL